MPSDTIQGLLNTQGSDRNLQDILNELESIPKDIAVIEKRIAAEAAALDEKRSGLRKLERERQDLEGSIRASEEKIIRFKNQQLEVKKNEEYTALQHEIEAEQAKIAECEDRELEVLERIDTEKSRVAELEEDFASDVALHRQSIQRLKKRGVEREADRAKAEKVFARDLATLPPTDRDLYQHLRKRIKRMPYLAPILNHTCQGCHMRVSNSIYEDAERGVLVYCDTCSRLVYVE